MKSIIMTLIIVFISLPALAELGLSNVVEKEIQRAPAMPQKQHSIKYVKETFYPYTIHMSSWRDPAPAIEKMNSLRLTLRPTFITKIDLGKKGVWYRVDYGLFATIKDAVVKSRELQEAKIANKGAFVGMPVPYAIEIGTFKTEEQALAEQSRLRNLGVISYMVKESERCFRLLVGAYPDKDSTKLAQDDLGAIGISLKITKR
ncbi:MAG: SPOR domain-containing protein [Thermodesulfobacteriota bacterium]|nr:SPOR domain-containing protein [Thermodesulfobacteriota bacterium]